MDGHDLKVCCMMTFYEMNKAKTQFIEYLAPGMTCPNSLVNEKIDHLKSNLSQQYLLLTPPRISCRIDDRFTSPLPSQ